MKTIKINLGVIIFFVIAYPVAFFYFGFIIGGKVDKAEWDTGKLSSGSNLEFSAPEPRGGWKTWDSVAIVITKDGRPYWYIYDRDTDEWTETPFKQKEEVIVHENEK